ncbi:unnamed protein product, partial [Mesorhabditis belari]|uniref:Post-GPI attachment to proteins factor 3 n=1 Tax=Mesorhabditis belari TaxID=2138241 RepID=A0AAF3EPF3_9BILA
MAARRDPTQDNRHSGTNIGYLLFSRLRHDRGYAVVEMMAWFSSTIFHCVECWVTEWMDYFVVCGLADICVAVLYT